MTDLSPKISIITLSVNGVNTPIKKDRLVKGIENWSNNMLSARNSVEYKARKQKVNRWEKIYHADSNF